MVLVSLSIQKKHAVFSTDKGEVTVKPGSDGAKTKVNGNPITGARVLEHNDRLIFGMDTHSFMKY